MEKSKKIFILEVKINMEKYYLADLNMTLSKNIKDSVLFNEFNTVRYLDGEIERTLEEKFNIPVSCYCIETEINDLISRKITS